MGSKVENLGLEKNATCPIQGLKTFPNPTPPPPPK